MAKIQLDESGQIQDYYLTNYNKKGNTLPIADIPKLTWAKLPTNAIISFSGVWANASVAAANATVTWVKSGDILLFAFNLTDGTDATSLFDATANWNNTIEQNTTDLSAKTIRFLFLSQQA